MPPDDYPWNVQVIPDLLWFSKKEASKKKVLSGKEETRQLMNKNKIFNQETCIKLSRG